MKAKNEKFTTAKFLIQSTLARTSLIFMTVLLGLSALTGCLQTRTAVKEQEEKVVLKKQVANLQQSTADVNTRFQEVQDEFLRLNGRIETNEARFARTDQKIDKNTQGLDLRFKEMDSKLLAYREEIDELKAQLATLQEENRRAQAQAQAEAIRDAQARAQAAEKGPYALAEDSFEKKNWKEAILDYEKYRKSNPKGKQFAMATYKIGVSFQELGLIDEAKAFYEEVIQKFPKSSEAGKAQTRLKSLSGKKK